MKKMKDILKRKVSVGLVAVMLVSQTPVTAFAAEITEPQAAVVSDELPSEEKDSDDILSNEVLPGSDDVLSGEGEGSSEEKPAFKASKSIDGVRITVETTEGVFPEGTVLSVEKVTKEQAKKAEEAVGEERPDDRQVAVSYTYDIKVLDKDGNEIQPTDETKVKVSFKLEKVADGNLTTSVYHIVEGDPQNGSDSGEAAPKEGDNAKNCSNEAETGSSAELTAEKLEVETDGDTAMVETGSFSLYTVEFTYENKQYVLPGDSEVELAHILDTVGLSGEVTEVSVSDKTLFSAEKNEGGEWIVTAHKAFSTKEWMKVIIDGVEYEITVTDAQMTWKTLKTNLNNKSISGRVTLKNDVTAGDGDSALEIPKDKRVILDLAGYTINANNKFGVIEVKGNLTLTDSSSGKTGKLTGGISKSQGGSGGGVYVNGGTFTMEGGTINGCEASDSVRKGGGVYVNSEGTFTMEGGTISGCSANNGGGVSVFGGSFNMKGGTISGCEASGDGGGVYVDDNGTFTMEGGTINGCEAIGDGYNPGGGGGVCVFGGTFTMSGGTISDCSASQGGVCVFDGTFNMSGAPVIRGNTKDGNANNVVLQNDKTITVTGALTDGAEIWVNANKGVAFAKNGDSYNITDTDLTKFHSDEDHSLVAAVDSDEKIKFFTPWGVLQAKFNNASTTENTPTVITLTDDVKAGTDDRVLEIPSGKTVTLDLNGHTIDRGLADKEAQVDGNVITVNGNLTLIDSSTGHTGKITGGNTMGPGGGVYNYGTFTMSGGTITGCSASQGGGVFVAQNGTFNMNGGTIKACNAKSDGGGVYVYSGKFTMSGGIITGCFVPEGTSTSDNNRGGGVCVFRDGEFTMSGGTISGCSTKNQCGAVYVYSNGKFNASGAPVIKDNTWGYGNSANYANNVLFQGGSIHVTGALTEGAEIWVKAVKGATVAVPGKPSGSGTSYTITAADAACFHGDGGGLIGELNNGNVVLMLALPKVTLSNANDKAYDGEAFEPQISFEGKTLTKDTDYTISYKEVVDTQETPLSAAPKDAGSYRLVVTGIGDYRGMQTADFTIKKAVIKPANVAAPTAKDDLTYTGQSLQLITAGSVSGNIGAMQYALGSDASTVPASGWSKTVPAGKDAGTYYVWYKITGDNNHKDVAAVSLNGIEIAKADYTNKTVSGNTKYGLSGTIELKNNIAPGGSLGTMTVSDTQEVLDGAPTLSGTVLSYKFKSLSENVGKAARVTVSVNNATNHKDYEVTATLNVINCDHLHTELRNIKEANCTEKGCKGDLYCKDCGSLIKKGEEIPIDPDNHDYHLTNTVAYPASPTGEVKTFTCSRCGRSYEDPEISTPVKDENGNTKETVKVGGVQVEEIVTDKDTGKETVNTKVWINGLEPSYTYTGSAIKPEFKVYDGTKLLTERTDYTVSFKNNKEVGDATVEIKFKGNYKDTKAEKLGFTISKAELGKHIIAHATAVAEKKSAQKPVPVLTWAATGKTVSSKNFDISYSPSTVKAAGEYTATITPKKGSKNFGGSTPVNIVVTTKDKVLSNARVTFDKKSYAYTGSAVIPGYSLILDGRTLTENVDYKRIDICNNIDPGTATVIFEGKGSYVGTKTVTFKIAGKIELTDSTDFTYTYNASVPFVKSGAKPAVSVRDNRNNVALKEGTDYTVSYSKNKSITGTPTIKIKGKGNYKGTVYRTFTITQQNISNLTIVAADQFVKKTKLKKATITIYDKDGNKLSSGKDFIVGDNGTLSGDDNTGTVTVSITGSGNYTGDTTATFRYLDSSANINKAGLKNKIADQSYTGNEVKLSYADLTNVLYTGSKTSPKFLTPGTDFEIVSYQNNIKRGTGKVVLKGKGSYAGTKTLSFRIVQRKVDYAGKL